MRMRRIAVLTYQDAEHGEMLETEDGEYVIKITSIPIGWTGAMSVQQVAKPQGPQAESLFAELTESP